MDCVGFGLMKTFAEGAVRDGHPSPGQGTGRERARALPLLRCPGNRPEPSFLWLLTHELNVRLMQIYSSHFSLCLYLLAADWHERASGSPDPADRCSRGSAAPAAAAGTEP